MEDDRRGDDPMDVEPAESRSLASNTYGSPSYSPPKLEEYTDQKGKLKKDYDKAAEEDDRDSKEARCNAKRKAMAPLSEEDYDTDERKADRRKSIARLSKYEPDSPVEERPDTFPPIVTPEPLASPPTAAAEATTMDTEDYWSGYEMRFGDADAAINETLSTPSTPSSSYNYEADNENYPSASSAVRKPLAERRGLAKPGDLVSLQQQQADSGWGRGRGRGRGIGPGWGLEWKETVTQKMAERQGWELHDDPYPSVEEDMQWEEYDELAWDRAAEMVKETEAGKATLKLSSAMRPEGSSMRATHSNRVTDMNSTKKRGDLVRAVTDYQAILRGTFLTYKKGDVMEVLLRDCDGKMFTLRPLEDGASEGRAYTKYFVPLDTADQQVHSDKAGGAGVEKKSG